MKTVKTHYLTQAQWIRAVWLWQRGNDTAQISDSLKVEEWVLYSKLPHYRAKYPNVEDAA